MIMTYEEKIHFVLEWLKEKYAPLEVICRSIDVRNLERAYKFLSDYPNIGLREFAICMKIRLQEILKTYPSECDGDGFLVRFFDFENQKDNHEIYELLKGYGYTCNGEYLGCPWVFVDVYNKVFEPGKPDVHQYNLISGHSINDDEFYTMINILETNYELTYMEEDVINYILK